MPAGRPSKYKPEYCEEVIALGKEGKSPVQMCAHFDISRQTLDNWAAEHSEFLEALTRAKTHCQAWWEKAGQEGMFLGGGGFNAAVWKKSMEARFREDYTERQEVAHTGTLKVSVNDMTDDDLAAIAAGVSSKV
jgi:transposase-like protein